MIGGNKGDRTESVTRLILILSEPLLHISFIG